ncbi:hypothetical protein NP493_4837g00010 [Ridgeia piscesae]|nr:hypothetical protein NP493_4837g00010 [Ridgeia piscesae]
MSRAGLSTGQVFYRLLQFVGPITLNPCVEQVLDSGTEWDSITQLIGSPRSLMHCCRLVIRNCLQPRHLVNDECIRMLAVPPPVVDYILYADL